MLCGHNGTKIHVFLAIWEGTVAYGSNHFLPTVSSAPEVLRWEFELVSQTGSGETHGVARSAWHEVFCQNFPFRSCHCKWCALMVAETLSSSFLRLFTTKLTLVLNVGNSESQIKLCTWLCLSWGGDMFFAEMVHLRNCASLVSIGIKETLKASWDESTHSQCIQWGGDNAVIISNYHQLGDGYTPEKRAVGKLWQEG